MTIPMNNATSLFDSYGMRSVSHVTENETGDWTTDVPLGDVRIRSCDLPWIAKKITKALTEINRMPPGRQIDATKEDISANLLSFFNEYIPSIPDAMRQARASTSVGGLLSEWLLLHWIRPSIYVGSGVSVGGSLRLADIALPYTTKWAYDLSFEPLLYRSDSVTYIQNDIEKKPPSIPTGKTAFAFFEDHVDCVRRILLCHELGIEWVLFDDSPTFGKLIGDRYPAMPTVSIILDEDMPDGTLLEWKIESVTSKTLSYSHNRSYCERARELIVGNIDMHALFQDRMGIRCGNKELVRLKVSKK